MSLKDITWPVVSLIAIVIAGVVVLALVGADVNVITNVLLALGLGGLFGVAKGIKDNTNGTQAEMLRALRVAMDKLAEMTPAHTKEGE